MTRRSHCRPTAAAQTWVAAACVMLAVAATVEQPNTGDRYHPRAPIPAAACYAPGTSIDFMSAIDRMMNAGSPLAFQQVARWSVTATDPGPYAQGDPTTLTYSFVPDGTFIPGLNYGSGGSSNLFAFLDGIYGDTQTWQNIYHDVFARWDAVSGLTLVHEPNDDGAPLGDAPGVLGVRGDIRLSGRAIDGNMNVIAFNLYPDRGDMVIDTSDGYFQNTSNDSIRLRNTISHEHGHGHGQAHVCPLDDSKVMEPLISEAFVGPQMDDILNAQRHYGDDHEPNDTIAEASHVGDAGNSSPIVVDWLSSDDDADVDHYRFTATDPVIIEVSVSPLGDQYLEGPQCSEGTPFDPATQCNLSLELIDADGVSVIESVNAGGPGESERTFGAFAQGSSPYIRVSAGGANRAQPYRLEITPQAGGVVMNLPSPAPGALSPTSPTTFPVRVLAVEPIVPGTALVHYRYDGGAWQSVPLTPAGPVTADTMYEAALPPPACGQTPEFYLSINGAESGMTTLPAAGAAAPFAAIVGDVVAYDLESSSFDAGMPAHWSATGLWTTTASCAPDGPCDGTAHAYYGLPSSCTYNTGGATDGSLLVEIDLPSLGPQDSLTLSYCSLLQTENFGGYDESALLIDGQTVLPRHAETMEWEPVNVDLAPLSGQTVTIEWRFDSVDGQFNSYLGWLIDNVQIVRHALECEATCAGDVAGVSPGTVNTLDLLAVLSAWGPCPGPCADCAADVALSDCSVGIADLLMVLANWGACQ